MVRGAISTLLLGLFVAHYGLHGPGAAAPVASGTRGVESPTAPAPSQTVTGAGTVALGLPHIAAAATQPIPMSSGDVPAGKRAPPPDIAPDVREGLANIDASARQLPGYMLQWAEQVDQHGIAGLAYEDPALAKAGQEIGAQMGLGIRKLANAVAKDMVSGAQQR